ncbi:MAG: CapA family protein [Candidatus Marinimicrobia bacterium]|nr:CapA family protein [Candidatus Neomarinimicrobiota bacterium]
MSRSIRIILLLNFVLFQILFAVQKKDTSLPDSSFTFTVSCVGDIMLGTSFPRDYLPPNDGKDIFRNVTKFIDNSDIAIGNLEGCIADSGKSAKCDSSENCYAFRMPIKYGDLLKSAGFNLLSIANNHINDFGIDGRKSTINTLDNLNIGWSGPPKTYAELQIADVKIAFIAFSPYSHSNDLRKIDQSKKIIYKLTEEYDVIIVSFHGGSEGKDALRVPDSTEYYYEENRGNLKKFTHAVINAGADLVFGHGPHVLRGMEVYKNRLIAYSLGNFATYKRFNLDGNLGKSAILKVDLDKNGRFVSGKIISIKQNYPGIPVIDRSNYSIKLINQLSNDDFPESGIKIDSTGMFFR